MAEPPPYEEHYAQQQSSWDRAVDEHLRWDRDDVFIIVMGVTGAGKSTFISLLAGEEDVEIGHGLRSTTKTSTPYKFMLQDGRTGWLLDTPGFDDTSRSDVEILKEVAFALAKLYERGAVISCILYLHRITDPRMGGSAILNLEILNGLCGPSAMPVVKLVSTHWEEMEPGSPHFENAQQREHQLRTSEKFWKVMLAQGATAARHFGTRDSALSIVNPAMTSQDLPTLLIQKELVDGRLPLDETAAGKVIMSKQQELQRQFERQIEELVRERDEAFAAKDEELSSDLAEELARQQKQRNSLQETTATAQRNMQIDFQSMNKKGFEVLASLDHGKSQSVSQDEQTRLRIDTITENIAEMHDELERNDKQRRAEIERERSQAIPVVGMRQRSADFATQAAYISLDRERQRIGSPGAPPAHHELNRIEIQEIIQWERRERLRNKDLLAQAGRKFFRWLLKT